MGDNRVNTLEELQSAFRRGRKLRFVFFWKPGSAGRAGPGCCSQWQPAPFTLDGQCYVSAEQYMMAEKARFFQDAETFRRILSTSAPQQVKRLGREIRNFNEILWAGCREEIVFQGNLAKFRQNQAFGNFLLGTGNKILAEASPHDRIWGIGLEETASSAKNPLLWKGKNLLGFCLMRVRADMKGQTAIL